jgi:hypothetical protein
MGRLAVGQAATLFICRTDRRRSRAGRHPLWLRRIRRQVGQRIAEWAGGRNRCR